MPTISATAPTISSSGITVPSFSDILAFKQAQLQSIFGSDIYIPEDSMDGQLLAIETLAISDANAIAQQIYNSFSPAFAQGSALSSNVKINGLERAVSSKSTVDVVVTGDVGAVLSNCVVADTSGNKWDLPASVTIPPAGEITVTATAQEEGAIVALAGTVTIKQTPTAGWQTVTNPSDAVPGSPVESDAELRIRQAASTTLPSLTALESITAALAAVSGVTDLKVYENDTASTDANGVPRNSVAAVIVGGTVADIANTIALKKGLGCGTFGSTSETVTDSYGASRTIKFSRPIDVPCTVQISLLAGTGYTTDIGQAISQSVADYINSLAIGESVKLTRLFGPALLPGSPDAKTFELTALTLNESTADVTVAFNAKASCDPSDVMITATTT